MRSPPTAGTGYSEGKGAGRPIDSLPHLPVRQTDRVAVTLPQDRGQLPRRRPAAPLVVGVGDEYVLVGKTVIDRQRAGPFQQIRRIVR